jgi:phosphoglycolate phosphatase-like HAD superfamily hydrolase
MIGDSAADVRCGRSFGAGTIWCAWGYAEAPGEETPDARAETPAQLPGLVRGLLTRPACGG